MRILGVDYGTVRIGVAVSDELGVAANALAPVSGKDSTKAIEAIHRICKEKNVQEIVVGLPLRTDGAESESTKGARRLAEKLREKTGLTVTLFDERMTTQAAERILIDADVSRKKRKEKIDSLSAAVFLQDYLNLIA